MVASLRGRRQGTKVRPFGSHNSDPWWDETSVDSSDGNEAKYLCYLMRIKLQLQQWCMAGTAPTGAGWVCVYTATSTNTQSL